MLAAGRKNRKGTFQRRTTTRDADSDYVESWTDIATRWVSVEPLNGNEFFSEFGENSSIAVRVRVRFDPALADVNSGCRLVVDGVAYDIEAPINDRMQNRELILACRAGYRIHV